MKHFSIEELTRSAKHPELVTTPTPEQIASARVLVGAVLDPLRDWLGSPIRINSGIRSPKLNKAVGGSITSQHLKGEAADIAPMVGMHLLRPMANYIVTNLDYDQMILYPTFVHVSFSAQYKNRKQALEVKGGRLVPYKLFGL